jgi:hypothetical protein
MVPRGGIHLVSKINNLVQSGTQNYLLNSLGFLCLESHRFASLSTPHEREGGDV